MANELTPKEKQELTDREQTRPGRTYVPDVDIREDEQALWLWADMPGVDQSSVEVELHDNVLRLEGQVSTKDYDGLSPIYTILSLLGREGQLGYQLFSPKPQL